MTKSKSKSKAKSVQGSAPATEGGGEKTGEKPVPKENTEPTPATEPAPTAAAAVPSRAPASASAEPESTTSKNSSKRNKNKNKNKNKDKDKETISSGHIPETDEPLPPIDYIGYESEDQLPDMVNLIENDLSEPYSIYTYRYFLHQWPELSFLAMDRDKNKCIGVIVCRLDVHGNQKSNRGYIAMLAVSKEYRKRRIGSTLVLMAIEAMKTAGADEIVLETEYSNQSAIALYLQMGFIKDKRLYRYYLNGVDAFRLKLFCKPELEAGPGFDGATA